MCVCVCVCVLACVKIATDGCRCKPPVSRLFINGKEGNVLFNDALNTFYFTVIWRRTYGKGPLR